MPRKALVVDSDFFFVEFLSGVLERRGYQVRNAYDGKEGIAGLPGLKLPVPPHFSKSQAVDHKPVFYPLW